MHDYRIKIGGATHPGLMHNLNEDAYDWVVLDSPMVDKGQEDLDCMAVVADGMGGMPAGEIASRMTVDGIKQQIQGYFNNPDSSLLLSGNTSVEDWLKQALLNMNNEVIEAGNRDHDRSGMGTTCTATIVSSGETLYVAHLGDSRAYVYKGKELVQLTRDHTWVQERVDTGNLTADEARKHARRNVVTRGIGIIRDPEVDTYKVNLSIGDKILLCTDGLNDVLQDKEIGSYLSAHEVPGRICESLVLEAVKAGGSDDITALVIEIM